MSPAILRARISLFYATRGSRPLAIGIPPRICGAPILPRRSNIGFADIAKTGCTHRVQSSLRSKVTRAQHEVPGGEFLLLPSYRGE